MSSLTPKQEKFCQEYVMYGGKTRAYKIAYDCDNMAPETINRKAFELFENGKITARVDELKEALHDTFKTDLHKTVKGIFNITNFDIAEIYDENGNLKNIHDIPKHVRTSISGIKTLEEFEWENGKKKSVGQTREVKTYNKLEALKDLMKHFGGYAEHNFQKKTDLSREDREARKAELLRKANASRES